MCRAELSGVTVLGELAGGTYALGGNGAEEPPESV